LNGALAYASTDNIEELGQAMGAGFAMGGALPVGQPGMRAGRSQAARNQSSVNFLEAKLGQDQLKHFRKMDPDARLAFATVEEAGIKAPKLMFVDKNLMLETLRQDDPNIRQAPDAYFDQMDNTIYVNENGRASKSSKEAFDILTHELGHGFITQAIKDDPFFARKILEQYEAKPGEKSFEFAFTKDSAGAPIDSIMLNEDAKKIASAYDSIQEGDKSIGVGQDANLLAQEIGAEQFAMMMVDNPNYFNTIEPSLRQKLLEASRKVLTLFGAVDGNTGNPLDVSISPILKRNKSIRNLYKNYTKQRDASIADKVDLADKGVAIKVRKGESADQAVDRMYGKVFGAKSFSLDDVSGFRINNKKIKKILTDIKDRLVESPEGSLRVERNQIVGKELNKDLKEALLFGDKLGNKNVLLNAMLEGIKNLTEFNFLYRAGKPSKYSDNELRARIVTPFQIRVTGLSPRSKSAASVKMDAYDLAYLRNNVEVLAREGFTDKPEDLIKEARRVAQQALEDPEGRINPEGNYENELVTAVFGQPESAQFIKNPKLRQLLEDKKLKHSIRSYDVDALAGLVPTGKSGIAFDWFNIKNNYSPFDDKLFIPAYHGTPHTFVAEPGAPLGRFRTSAIGTGEGAQAYGHGLYFAGRKEVAEFYREQLAPTITKDFKVGTMNIFKDEVPMDYSPDKLERVYGKEANARASLIEDLMIDEGTIRRAFIEDGEKGAKREVKKVIESFLDSYEGEADYIKVGKKALDMPVKFDTTEPGSLYKVELAPKENEYLLWDKPLSEQPKGVREKVREAYGEVVPVKLLSNRYGVAKIESDGSGSRVSDLTGDTSDLAMQAFENDFLSRDGRSIYRDMSKADQESPAASAALKEAGIPGIKYLDGSSRSKGEGDYNYVIFDEADVQITDKLFMPASEAGAGKGKQAEAAKLWQEKGTDSPYFKKWFGKSKVVDENGEPLVVYHGTPSGEFNVFDYDRIGNLGRMEGQGFYFATDKGMAQSYMGKDGRLMEVYLDIEKPMSVEQKGFDADTLETLLMEIAEEQHRYDPEVPIDEGFLADYGGLYNAVDLISKNETALDQLGDLMGAGVNAEFINTALKKVTGFDGVKAKITDKANDFTSDIYVAFSPEQIKSATGNRGTFDAGERNINYMPTDSKAPTRQPANRITRQAPAMPGNRFMLPAATAGAKSAERFR
jgi:hypothetical protein